MCADELLNFMDGVIGTKLLRHRDALKHKSGIGRFFKHSEDAVSYRFGSNGQQTHFILTQSFWDDRDLTAVNATIRSLPFVGNVFEPAPRDQMSHGRPY